MSRAKEYCEDKPVRQVSMIFHEASIAFSQLSDLTSQLDHTDLVDTGSSGKWTQHEIDMLSSIVHRFAVDLNELSDHIKTRTVALIRNGLLTQAYEEANIPLWQASTSTQEVNTVTRNTVNAFKKDVFVRDITPEITLNQLNASEKDENLECLNSDLLLNYDANNDEVRI